MARIRKRNISSYLLGGKTPQVVQPPNVNLDEMEAMSAAYHDSIMNSIPTSGWNKLMSKLTPESWFGGGDNSLIPEAWGKGNSSFSPEAFMGLFPGKSAKNAGQALNIAGKLSKAIPKAGGVIGAAALPAAFVAAVVTDQIGIKRAKKEEKEKQAAWNAYYHSLVTGPNQGTLGFGQAYGGLAKYGDGDSVVQEPYQLQEVEIIGKRKKEVPSQEKLKRLLYLMQMIDSLSSGYAYGDQVQSQYANQIPIQAEKYGNQKEWIASPDDDLYPTATDERHEEQESNVPSDVVEENSKVFSARMSYTPSQLKAIISVLNKNGFNINENLISYSGKKGKTSTAKIVENIAKKYQKPATPNSFDTQRLNDAHKEKLVADAFKLNQVLNGKYKNDTAMSTPSSMEQGTRQFAPGGTAGDGCQGHTSILEWGTFQGKGAWKVITDCPDGCVSVTPDPGTTAGQRANAPCIKGDGSNNPTPPPPPPKDDACAKCVAELVAKGTAEADARVICGCAWPKLKCPAGQRWSDQLQRCVPDETYCPPGQVWSDALKTCVPKGLDSPCPPGYEDIGMGECVPILGSSADRSSMDKQCEDCLANYKKHFGLDDAKARDACMAVCTPVETDDFKKKNPINANLLNYGLATAGNLAELFATRQQDMYRKAELPDFVTSMPTEVPGKRQMQDRLLANAYPYMNNFMRSGPAGMANAQMMYSNTLDKIGEVALQMLPMDAQLQAARRQAQQQRAGTVFANDQQYNVDSTALSNLKKKAPAAFLTKQAENSEKLVAKLMDDRYRQLMAKILAEQAGLPNEYFNSIIDPRTGQLLIGTGGTKSTI